MKTLHIATYFLILLSLTLIIGCGRDNDVQQTNTGKSVEVKTPQVFGICFGNSADSILSAFEPPMNRAWKKTSYGMNEPSVKIWIESAITAKKIDEYERYDRSLDEVSYIVDSGKVNEIWLALSSATSKDVEVTNVLSKDLGIEGIEPDSVMSWGRDQKSVWISGSFLITRLLGADSSIHFYVTTM